MVSPHRAPPENNTAPEPPPFLRVGGEQPTQEKVYGGSQTSYVARLHTDGRVQLHVYYRNRQVRAHLRGLADNPTRLLLHEDAYGRSGTRAQYWMAQVIADYREC